MSITILGCQWGTLGPALCIPTIISSPAAAKYKYKIQHLSLGPCKPHLSCGEQHQDWRGHGVTAKAGWMRGGAMAHTSMLCTKDWHGLKSSADCLQPRLENKLECTVHSYTCVQNESRKWPKSPSCGHKEGWQQNSKCNLFFLSPFTTALIDEKQYFSGDADSCRNKGLHLYNLYLLKLGQFVLDIVNPLWI